MTDFLIGFTEGLGWIALTYGIIWIILKCAVMADEKRGKFVEGFSIGTLIALIIVLTIKMIVKV